MKYLKEALQSYNMEYAKTKLIRHNENMTIKVEDGFLLRIHKHAEGFTTDYLYESLDRKAIYREELRFLSYLHDSGMQVQIPVKNKLGEEVTVLSDGTLATMLAWLPGRAMEPADISGESCYKIGEMVARLHQLAKGYVPNAILKYDANLCTSLKEKICLAGQSNEAKVNVLLGIGLHLENWIEQEWFPSRLERWCREMFEPLREGKELFSPDFYLLNVKN